MGMPKRRSLCPLTWLPSPRTKRPPEFACRSQAWLASTVGLRGKATATDGVSSIRPVAAAAKASGVNGSCPNSTVITPSKPAVSAAAANGPASRQSRIGNSVKTRTVAPRARRQQLLHTGPEPAVELSRNGLAGGFENSVVMPPKCMTVVLLAPVCEPDI